jgi:hypothetical protein
MAANCKVVRWSWDTVNYATPNRAVCLDWRSTTLQPVGLDIRAVPIQVVAGDVLIPASVPLLEVTYSNGQSTRTEYWEPSRCVRNLVATSVRIVLVNRLSLGVLAGGLWERLSSGPLLSSYSWEVTASCTVGVMNPAPYAYFQYTVPSSAVAAVYDGVVPVNATHVSASSYATSEADTSVGFYFALVSDVTGTDVRYPLYIDQPLVSDMIRHGTSYPVNGMAQALEFGPLGAGSFGWFALNLECRL